MYINYHVIAGFFRTEREAPSPIWVQNPKSGYNGAYGKIEYLNHDAKLTLTNEELEILGVASSFLARQMIIDLPYNKVEQFIKTSRHGVVCGYFATYAGDSIFVLRYVNGRWGVYRRYDTSTLGTETFLGYAPHWLWQARVCFTDDKVVLLNQDELNREGE